MSTEVPSILVTGASGQLGRRVASLLLEAGTANVIAASRDARSLDDLARRGATVRRLDFSNAESLGPALEGVDRLLLISTDLISGPGIRLRQQTRAIDAAVAAGVQHIVYTSITRPEPGSRIPFAIDHHETERHLAESGIGFTVLRNNQYMEMLPHTLGPALASGELVTLTGEGACAYVAREDCARVAAAVLSKPPAGNVTLDVTGPAAVSYGELARIAAEVLHRPLGMKVVPEGARQGALAALGMPAVIVDLILSSELAAASGHVDTTSPIVEQWTGRVPQSVREFLSAHPELLRPPGQPGSGAAAAANH